MSGGHFNYIQFNMLSAIEELEKYINQSVNQTPDEYGYTPPEFRYDVISKMYVALETLQDAQKMLHHVDYLICGDYGEDTFVSCWEKDIYNG